MILYQRNINNKLLILWTSFVLLLTVLLYSIIKEQVNLTYFISVVLLLISLIHITGITIYKDSFVIHKYYLFGFIRKSWKVDKHQTLKAELYSTEEIPDIPDTNTWLDIIAVFLFGWFITERVQGLTIKNCSNKFLLKNFSIGLSKEEYNLMDEILKRFETEVNELN